MILRVYFHRAYSYGRDLGAVLPLSRCPPPIVPSLFGMPRLGDGTRFDSLGGVAVNVCQELLAQVKDSRVDALERVRALDRCSQAICSVIDPSELARTVHPNVGVRRAADASFNVISKIISQFNTDVGLYHAMLEVQRAPQYGQFSEETHRVVESFVTEFEAHGMDLDERGRTRVVDLQAEIAQLAFAFQGEGVGLEKLLTRRWELAQLLGKRSYADLVMRGRLVETPERAFALLDEIARSAPQNKPEEVNRKRWRPISFTIEEVLQALQRVMQQTFGLSLAVRRGSEWAPLVWELTLERPVDHSIVGHVFLDLFARRGKQATMTATYMLSFEVENRFRDEEKGVNRCAVVASLADADCLSLADANCIFHEWGHVMNALLSRTEYQHLAGTRGPVDFVEVPSLMFEHFGWDPVVMQVDERALIEHRKSEGLLLFF